MKTVSLNRKAKKLALPALEKMQKARFLERLNKKDASLWKKDTRNKKIIANALGWVEIAQKMIKNLPAINSFADSVRKKFDACVVLGMGGSSLAPEVFRTVFKPKKNYPKLHILDSTHPQQILDTEKKLNLEKTLFIFASKSGTTIEPHSQFVYFYDKLKKITKNPGQNFIAITDKATPLAKLAAKHKFTKTFINPSDIGGRFAALSYFGLLPAALMGIDIKKLLVSAIEFSKKYLKTHKRNPSLILGSLLGQASLEGIDKLTFILPKKIEPFGLWIEQLIAESTGKENKGIVPIVGEPLIADFNYSSDRIFVNFIVKNKHSPAYIKNQYPMVNLYLNDIYDLGKQFFLWELATAAAGFILKINPFSQPDVEKSKIFMRKILKNLPKKEKIKSASNKFTYSKAVLTEAKEKKLSLKNPAEVFYNLTKKASYAGILAYLNAEQKTKKLLQNLRKKITTKTAIATLFGYGPRYLHSSGQLHKGGKNNGIFLIIGGLGKTDIKIETKKQTFGHLILAQSLGDFKALDVGKRKVIAIYLAHPATENLKKIVDMF